jgi:hypothetical protein
VGIVEPRLEDDVIGPETSPRLVGGEPFLGNSGPLAIARTRADVDQAEAGALPLRVQLELLRLAYPVEPREVDVEVEEGKPRAGYAGLRVEPRLKGRRFLARP